SSCCFHRLTLRPPNSTLFPTRRSSDLKSGPNCGNIGSIAMMKGNLFQEKNMNISSRVPSISETLLALAPRAILNKKVTTSKMLRSEEHTSELQSRFDIVCRLLLEKKHK